MNIALQSCLIAPLLVVGTLFPQQEKSAEFQHLFRLTEALKAYNYPDNDDKIIVFMQHGKSGISLSMTEDEDLFTAIRGFGDAGKTKDLKNVCILNSDRRRIRIVDLSEPEKVKMADLELRLGDLVVLLDSLEEDDE